MPTVKEFLLQLCCFISKQVHSHRIAPNPGPSVAFTCLPPHYASSGFPFLDLIYYSSFQAEV